MHIFTYGTLMAPAVWKRVVKGRYNSLPGHLAHFKRLCVTGENYPGLIRSTGSEVDGIVYFDVEPGDVERLDLFEGDEYERIIVQVMLEKGGEISCRTYLFKEAFRQRLSDAEWSYEEFLRKGIREFLDRYSGWERG